MNKPNEKHYEQFRTGAVFARLENRTLIEVQGEDRVSFLHNLCTSDIRSLDTGSGCEAFFTTVQGKTLLHALVFREVDSIIIESSPNQSGTILPHLDKYLIREDVRLCDRSQEWREVWVAGPAAEERLGQIGLAVPGEMLAHTSGKLAGICVQLRRMPFAQVPCFAVQALEVDVDSVISALVSQELLEVEQEIVQVARVEASFPEFGPDVTLANLPQEVARDAVAISFTKGCYLGQETVARIDAMGHVNRQLVQLEFVTADSVPPAGTQLSHDEKVVGSVTSSCWSPASSSAMALGHVRREAIESGDLLRSEFGNARIASAS